VLAATLMVALGAALRALLPESRPEASLPYPALLRSLFTLAREEPVLREATALGALGFASFSVFWRRAAASRTSRGSASREGAGRSSSPPRLASPSCERRMRSGTARSRRFRAIGSRGRAASVAGTLARRSS